MKKMISMMVAILVAFSALAVHASAARYEFIPGSYNEHNFSGYAMEECNAWVYGGSDYSVNSYTESWLATVPKVSVSVEWDTNVSPEFESITVYAFVDEYYGEVEEAIARIFTEDYIASDYTIFDFLSTHCIYNASGSVIGEIEIRPAYQK